MRRPPRSNRVRAAAVLLALVAHALLWGLLSSYRPTAVNEPAPWQLVSIWPPDQPPPAVTHVPSPRQSRTRAPTAPNPQPVIVPAIPAESQSTAPQQQESPRPSIDWYGEAADAAARSATRGDQSTFSPPPKVLRQACKPKRSSFEWNPEEKKVGYLPVPYLRVGNCIVGPGLFACDLNGPPPANGHLFDELKKGERPVSSVPDPNTCD